MNLQHRPAHQNNLDHRPSHNNLDHRPSHQNLDHRPYRYIEKGNTVSKEEKEKQSNSDKEPTDFEKFNKSNQEENKNLTDLENDQGCKCTVM